MHITNAGAQGVAVDAIGGVYVVGNSNGHGIVRYSVGGGTNWITRDDFTYPGKSSDISWLYVGYNAVTIDVFGNVFAGGGFATTNSLPHWVVRRSKDQGLTWETVDDFFIPNVPPLDGRGGSVLSLASDQEGRLYGGGPLYYAGPSYAWWMVRGSPTGGTNWQPKTSGFVAYGNGGSVACAGDKAYVASNYGDPLIGMISESTDAGVSWATNIQCWGHSIYGITCDTAGNLNTTGDGWGVSMVAPGATNLTTLDNYLPAGATNVPIANAIAVDSAGNICVVGSMGHQCVTRRYSVATGQWSTTDELPYSQGVVSTATGIAIDAYGNVFVVGYQTAASGQHSWLVRKRAAGVPQPVLRLAATGQLLSITWPVSVTNWTLEWADSPLTNANWMIYEVAPSVQDGQNFVNVSPTNRTGFFRLRH